MAGGVLAKGGIIGVDVGGTFTDLVMLDPDTGSIRMAKTATTLDNQAFGFLNALKAAGCDLAALGLIVHGTTTTTNAVLERKLSKTGLITTLGFRDILELGRRTRPQPYGMKGEFTPIIPRNLRLEVPERMDCNGNILTQLDEAAVRNAAQTLVDQGCESVVIHFLHAYANPTHEQRAAAVVAEIWPNDHITMGHALLSESREFERGVTAAANAAVQPLLDRYIRRLVQELQGGGYAGDVLVMNGNGGMVSPGRVAKGAAETVLSKLLPDLAAGELVEGADAFGGIHPDIPVVQVLKAGERIGWAYITSDFVSTTGYSGKLNERIHRHRNQH